jgi:hypothetical protein
VYARCTVKMQVSRYVAFITYPTPESITNVSKFFQRFTDVYDLPTSQEATSRTPRLHISAIAFLSIAFLGTLASGIWSLVLQHILSKNCHLSTVLSEYSTRFQCTREQAACMILPVIARGDEGKRRLACLETVCLHRSSSLMRLRVLWVGS